MTMTVTVTMTVIIRPLRRGVHAQRERNGVSAEEGKEREVKAKK